MTKPASLQVELHIGPVKHRLKVILSIAHIEAFFFIDLRALYCTVMAAEAPYLALSSVFCLQKNVKKHYNMSGKTLKHRCPYWFHFLKTND